MKNASTRKTGTTVMLLLLIFTLVFIFTQSLLPPSTSGEESGRVAAFLERILPESGFRDFLVGNVRKIAHFSEFGVLGLEAALFVFFTFESFTVRRGFLTAGFGLLSGFLDESLQMLSGRGPAIPDVWIDFSGFVTFGVLASLVFLLVRRLARKKKE